MNLIWSFFFLQTPTLIEWYMARLVVKNGHQNDTFFDNIGTIRC